MDGMSDNVMNQSCFEGIGHLGTDYIDIKKVQNLRLDGSSGKFKKLLN